VFKPRVDPISDVDDARREQLLTGLVEDVQASVQPFPIRVVEVRQVGAGSDEAQRDLEGPGAHVHGQSHGHREQPGRDSRCVIRDSAYSTIVTTMPLKARAATSTTSSFSM